MSRKDTFFLQATKLLGCSLAIYFCFITYGIIQEQIYTREYNGEKFKYSFLLVWFQTFGNGVFAGLLWFVQSVFFKTPTVQIPATAYFTMSFSYIGAMFSSNLALNYMSYPAQALAKSCKMIPVMIMRIFINRKRYSLREYIQVALITGGIFVFMASEDAKKSSKETTVNGIVLCLVSLALDGFTGPKQEAINEKYQPSMAQMMFYLNFWAFWIVCSYVAIGLALGSFDAFRGLFDAEEIWKGLYFCSNHPEIIPLGLLFGILSALGQASILLTLLTFNSLVCTTITTTRKFFTILASVVFFGHHVNYAQWAGVFLVFGGLGFEILDKYNQSKHKKKYKD